MLESLSKEDSGFLFEDLGRFDTPVEMCLKEHSQTAPNVQIRNGVGMTILGMSSGSGVLSEVRCGAGRYRRRLGKRLKLRQGA